MLRGCVCGYANAVRVCVCVCVSFRYLGGIPQVLLDFAKEINAKVGPMEEQVCVCVCVCVSCGASNSMQTEQCLVCWPPPTQQHPGVCTLQAHNCRDSQAVCVCVCVCVCPCVQRVTYGPDLYRVCTLGIKIDMVCGVWESVVSKRVVPAEEVRTAYTHTHTHTYRV